MIKGKEAERIINKAYDIYWKMISQYHAHEKISSNVFIDECLSDVLNIVYNKETMLKRIKYRLMEDCIEDFPYVIREDLIKHFVQIATIIALKDIDELLQQ